MVVTGFCIHLSGKAVERAFHKGNVFSALCGALACEYAAVRLWKESWRQLERQQIQPPRRAAAVAAPVAARPTTGAPSIVVPAVNPSNQPRTIYTSSSIQQCVHYHSTTSTVSSRKVCRLLG